MPMDSHVWGAMVEWYHIYMPKLTYVAQQKDWFVDDMEWYSQIQILKVWLKSVIPLLKYSIFCRGLLFTGAPCRLVVCTLAATELNCACASRRSIGLRTQYPALVSKLAYPVTSGLRLRLQCRPRPLWRRSHTCMFRVWLNYLGPYTANENCKSGKRRIYYEFFPVIRKVYAAALILQIL